LQDQVLALYDVTGIQRYIFQTRKLKDIMGASALVGDALGETVKKVLEELSFPEDAPVYSGGGNAILSFNSRDEWKVFNGAFTRKLMTEVPGMPVITACNERSSDEVENRIDIRVGRLYREIAKKKALGGNSLSICTLPPMAQSNADQMPVSVIETTKEGTDEYSYASWVKNDKGKQVAAKNSYDPIEFDTIAEKPEGMKEAERLMAVVHIDGNNMGQIFDSACKHARTAADIKNLSVAVNDTFKKALEAIWTDEQEKVVIPAQSRRMIYQSGDDVTYVCHGAYALKSVMRFIETLNKARKGNDLIADLSASAGIAYVKPHFPFYRAYSIAEGRCKAAKKRAREQYSQQSSMDIGSWIDFEIVRGSDNARVWEDRYMRPYCIIAPDDRNDMLYHIDKLNTWLGTIQAGARSKWKALRNSYLLGGVESVGQLMKSCDMELPSNDDEKRVVFDALDLMDVEVPVDEDKQSTVTTEQEGAL